MRSVGFAPTSGAAIIRGRSDDPETWREPMAHNDKPHLKAVKEALADKYMQLSKLANSDTKRRHFARKANKYRRQAAEITVPE